MIKQFPTQKVLVRSGIQRYAFFLRYCILLPATLFFWTGAVSAQSIAFFPLLDLSKDPNGINSQLTERVRQELLGHAKNLIPAEKIMDFLIRNRIRKLGNLTVYQTSLVRKELKADLILLGTICQVNDGEEPVLSLNLQLSRTTDARIVWAQTKNLSYSDLTSLLGIDTPQTLADLYGPFFEGLFASLPQDVGLQEESFNTLNVATVYIKPTTVRPGEEVFCRIKMHKSLDEKEIQPDLYVQIGEQKYPLVFDAELYYLEASWIAEQDAGAYPVSLVADWPSGITRKGAIGSYSVDDHASGVKLFLIGTERDGEILFSEKLMIIPKLLEPEPIIRWEIVVTDEDEEVIVLMGAPGNIPRSLTWAGKTSLGNVAPPGQYVISFKAWDRAERESSAEASVQYMPEVPEIVMEITKEEERVIVDLDSATDTPLNFWWAKFYQEDGSLLKLIQGTELPVAIELGIRPEEKERIECLLAARDILGNQYEQKILNLLQQAENEDEETDTSIETEWVEEF